MDAFKIRTPIPSGRESQLSFAGIDWEQALMLDRLIDASRDERGQSARAASAKIINN